MWAISYGSSTIAFDRLNSVHLSVHWSGLLIHNLFVCPFQFEGISNLDAEASTDTLKSMNWSEMVENMDKMNNMIVKLITQEEGDKVCPFYASIH